MKRLHFQKPNDLSRLHDELLAAIPSLRPVINVRGEREPVMQVEGKGNDIWLTVPDGADEAAIGAVVTAHVPRAPQTPKLWAAMTSDERLEAVRQRLGIA